MPNYERFAERLSEETDNVPVRQVGVLPSILLEEQQQTSIDLSSRAMANIRRVAAETGITVADATVIATLKDKYDCRQAGASLAETLENIATKNGQQLESLGRECKERTANITAPWTSAQETYATEFPKVVKEQVEQFFTAKKAADETFQTLVNNRTDAVEMLEMNYNGTKRSFAIAAAAYATAKGAWENEKYLKETSENKFNAVVTAGKKLNANTFESAKQSANTTMNELITVATNALATAGGLCTRIKNEREKHIIADEDLLNNDIGPLIKELSELKCVDSYDDAKTAGDTIAPAAVETKVTPEQGTIDETLATGTVETQDESETTEGEAVATDGKAAVMRRRVAAG